MKKTILFLFMGIRVFAQQTNPYNANTVFEQMGTALPTPNTYRTASGAPGKEYWQQKADYDIKVDVQFHKVVGGFSPPFERSGGVAGTELEGRA